MPTGVYQTSVECPFYKHDNGQKHRITCEGLIEDSCLALVFQRRKDYQIHITTFCCEHYKRCEVYRMLMQKYGNTSIERLSLGGSIGANALDLCDSLKEIMFGSGTINDANMNSKWAMLMTSETPPTIGASSPVWGTYPIYVPDSAVDAYKAASGWSNVAAYIFPASEYPDK